jgi:zinc transporter 1/2/3
VFGLLLALCLHSFLEGLAIGVEKTGDKVLFLLGAVCCHKFVVAFCLGVELCANSDEGRSNSCSHLIKIMIFSFGSVGGIAIGVALDDIDAAWKQYALPIMQGLAGGTLLYITVCEVLPREKAKWHNNRVARNAGIVQLAAVILGFIVMTLLNVYLSD